MKEQNIQITEKEIQKKLIQLGVAPSIKGFDYATEAIRLISEDSDYKHEVTKKLYPDVAKKFNTTPTRVERAIRHAVERL